MMRKILCSLLSLILLVALVAVPVSAEGLDSGYNLLDYGFPNGSSSSLIYMASDSSSLAATFDLPFRGSPSYMEIVFQSCYPISEVYYIHPSSVHGKQNFSVTCIDGTNNYYRAYINFEAMDISELTVYFSCNHVFGWINFLSANIFYTPIDSYPEVGRIDGWCGASSNTASSSMSSSSSSASISFDQYANGIRDYQFLLSCDNWRKYDYIDFFFTVQTSSIDSIRASFNNTSVPFDLSFIDSDMNTVSYDSSILSSPGRYFCVARLDLRGLNRTDSGNVTISVSGVVPVYEVPYFRLTGVTGYLFTDSVDSEITWLQRIQKSITDFKDSVVDRLDRLIGSGTEGDELEQGSQEIQDQVGEIQDFEQSQQDILDNSLPEIQQSVSISGFSSALAFVQRYTNGIFLAMGDFKIIYSMPIFIGLFFFICGRIPGATSLRSPPKADSGKKEGNSA